MPPARRGAAKAGGQLQVDPSRPAAPDPEDRAVFREIFHLFFQARQPNATRTALDAERLLAQLTSPLLRSKAQRYVDALESRRAAG